MSRQYYKCKATGIEYTISDTLTNGVILSKFDPKEGYPLHEGRVYTSVQELDLDFSKIDFKTTLDVSEVVDKQVVIAMKKILNVFWEYGLLEQQETDREGFSYCEGQVDGLTRVIGKTFSNNKDFEKWYRATVTCHLNDEDDMEYGQGYGTALRICSEIMQEIRLFSEHITKA